MKYWLCLEHHQVRTYSQHRERCHDENALWSGIQLNQDPAFEMNSFSDGYDEMNSSSVTLNEPNDITSDNCPDLIEFTSLALAELHMTNNLTNTASTNILRLIKYVFDNTVGENHFPRSWYHFMKKHESPYFNKKIICASCYALHDIGTATIAVEGRHISKKCQARLFENRVCREELLNEKLKPKYTYRFTSLKEFITDLVKNPEFKTKANWHLLQGQKSASEFHDIYDGEVWKAEFGEFFADPNSLGIIINIDWFTPYKYVSTYSIGVIYGVVANLSRHDRYRTPNTFLLGVIPNMEKEPSSLNSFLDVLVDELIEGYEGWPIIVQGDTVPTLFKVALVQICSDLPAARKACGFLSHSATFGCSRCKKKFVGEFGHHDYSGSDSSHDMRTNSETRQHMLEVRRTTRNVTARRLIESSLGVRYSVFIRLPYYLPVTFCVIDVMHNLYQGTSKLLLKLWEEK